jgi:hypothetical protein
MGPEIRLTVGYTISHKNIKHTYYYYYYYYYYFSVAPEPVGSSQESATVLL